MLTLHPQKDNCEAGTCEAGTRRGRHLRRYQKLPANFQQSPPDHRKSGALTRRSSGVGDIFART
jgi:hypothetical protein